MKILRSELDDAFNMALKNTQDRYTEEEMEKRLNSFSDENGKLNIFNLITFLQIENISNTKSIVYDVLEQVLPIEEDSI